MAARYSIDVAHASSSAMDPTSAVAVFARDAVSHSAPSLLAAVAVAAAAAAVAAVLAAEEAAAAAAAAAERLAPC